MVLLLLMIILISLKCSFCMIRVKLKKILKRAQNEFDAKVEKIRSDNDTEFKNTQVEDFLDKEGN
jgi:predicted Co/Zn/Cd cation transporter (cation efflux family)